MTDWQPIETARYEIWRRRYWMNGDFLYGHHSSPMVSQISSGLTIGEATDLLCDCRAVDAWYGLAADYWMVKSALDTHSRI